MGAGAGLWSALPAATTQDPAALTLRQASDLLRRRDASPVDLTQACLKRIDQLNPYNTAAFDIYGLPQFPFRAVSPLPDCPSGFRSAALILPNPLSSP
jgi:hypothetical protein